MIEQGEVSVIIVTRLDRLTRVIRLHKKLLDLFEEKNVRFISIMEGLDSNSKSGKKVLEALKILALWDAKSIPDRTRRMI